MHENLCVLLNPLRLGLSEKKKSHLPDYLHDSPALWNFKEARCEVCFLPASRFLREEGRGSGGSSSTALVLWGVLWEVEIQGGAIPLLLHGGLHLPRHRPPLHTPMASIPPTFCANALLIRQAPWELPGKSQDTIFLPLLIFIQGCLSHTTALEGCGGTSVVVSSSCLE